MGQHVAQGQVIGLSGCTGRCYGPHLHFEVRINGVVTNPLNYL
jgi:murein DD-endopeptidase MepM/ murein hydrolase activator NlpD